MKLQKLMFAIAISVFSHTVIIAQEAGNTKIIENKEYTCTMHPEIISNSPEFCPKCGMKLTEKGIKIEPDKKVQTFTCSMHPEVISDKAGMCPKCGMNLILKEQNSNKEMGMMHHNHKGMMYAGGIIMVAMMVVVMLLAF